MTRYVDIHELNAIIKDIRELPVKDRIKVLEKFCHYCGAESSTEKCDYNLYHDDPYERRGWDN